MFGFLHSPCSGCRSREHSVYRAHFCGLCNRLRMDYGLPMRFLVNRDATFLSILGNGLKEVPESPVQATCCNPLGRRRWVVQDGDAVRYAAAVTICGLKAKLADELTDRRRSPARFALRGVNGALNTTAARAEKHLCEREFPVREVLQALGRQDALEREATREGKIDLKLLSGPTSFAFGHILAHTAGRGREPLEQIGRSLGRLIYIMDAWMDRARDAQSRQFNPFLLEPRLVHTAPETVNGALVTITTAMESLHFPAYREVLELILGANLRRTCASLLGSDPETGEASAATRRRDHRQSTGGQTCTWSDCCDVFCCPDCLCACSDGDLCCCDCS